MLRHWDFWFSKFNSTNDHCSLKNYIMQNFYCFVWGQIVFYITEVIFFWNCVYVKIYFFILLPVLFKISYFPSLILYILRKIFLAIEEETTINWGVQGAYCFLIHNIFLKTYIKLFSWRGSVFWWRKFDTTADHCSLKTDIFQNVILFYLRENWIFYVRINIFLKFHITYS